MKNIFDKYQYDEEIIDEFLGSIEIKVGINPISWKNTLKKILVWDGFEMDRNFDYSKVLSSRKSNIFKSGIKYLNWKLSNHPVDHSPIPIIESVVVFYLNDIGEIDVLENILIELEKRKIPFSIYFKENKQKRSLNKQVNIHRINCKNIKRDLKIKFRKWPSQGSLYVLNRLIDKADEILFDLNFLSNQLERNKKLKKIIFIAGENKFNASLFCEILKGKKVKVENLMNGAKIGWAHDRDIDFSRWYVWTDKMAQFLHKKANNPIEKLVKVGHPLQDKISNYQYSACAPRLDQFKTGFSNIVSLFTSSIKFQHQVEFYKEVIHLVTKNKNVGLVIKPHPSDRDLSYLSIFETLPNLLFLYDFFKAATLDLISISDYTISISSTLSFESIWMGIPNISFEQENQSFLPIDNSDLFYHVNRLGEIQQIHERLINKTSEKKKEQKHSVTEKYVDLILD